VCFIKRIIFLSLIVFSLSVFSPLFVISAYASTDTQMESVNVSFQSYSKEYVFGAIYGAASYDWKWTFVQGSTNMMNIKVYDADSNLITEGLTGSFGANVKFPVKFVLDTQETNFRLDIKITPHPPEKEEIDYRPNFGDLSSKLSSIGSQLSALDNFLSNPQPFYNAIARLESQMEKISDYGPNGVAADIQEDYSNSFKPSGNVVNLPSLQVEFIKGQGKINVFDLTQMGGEIATIRRLMRAILYLGVVFFIMQGVVPQFKI